MELPDFASCQSCSFYTDEAAEAQEAQKRPRKASVLRPLLSESEEQTACPYGADWADAAQGLVGFGVANPVQWSWSS